MKDKMKDKMKQVVSMPMLEIKGKKKKKKMVRKKMAEKKKMVKKGSSFDRSAMHKNSTRQNYGGL